MKKLIGLILLIFFLMPLYAGDLSITSGGGGNITISPPDYPTELDAYLIVGSTTTIGTTPFRISAYRDYDITITTMTAKIFGGTNCVGMIEQRLRSADGSSGTDIWTGDITITTAE